MSCLRSSRGVAFVLVLFALTGGAACRKGKPSGGNPDQPDDPNAPGDGSVKLPPLGVPSRPALPAGWQEFKHPEGAFSVYVPARPARPRQSAPSLKLKQPLQSMEARESTYEVLSAAKQPFFVSLQVTVFHPDGRSAFAMLEPDYKVRQTPAGWTVTSDRVVTWGGLRATEMVVEVPVPGRPPERTYTVSRWAVTADRLYQFVLRREDRMPTDAERAAFFDSFTPGG